MSDEFFNAYMECVAFTECHSDNPELADAEFSEEFLSQCREVCADFLTANENDLAESCLIGNYSIEYAGHDFWLTRNGHGAGFWDRGLGNVGDRLSRAAKVYGSVDVYAGDDGLIYGI
jgi:hypothetical protein